MYPRQAEARIRKALRDTPIVTISGPRQSGKTTLAKRFQRPAWRYLSLDDATLRDAARRDPVAFVAALDRAIIDEVQRAPDLLLAIKRAVDEDRRAGRFILTGSANLLTIPTVRESLAGRVETIPLYPLARSEILRAKRTTFLRARDKSNRSIRRTLWRAWRYGVVPLAVKFMRPYPDGIHFHIGYLAPFVVAA